MKFTLSTHCLAVALSTLCGLPLAASAQAQQPYAGQQQRPIKALSDAEQTALREGRGMGLAKAAELNGYPGPMHVLELAAPLALSPEQQAATQRLMGAHKARARDIGQAVVEAEAALDALFVQRQATPDAVLQATARIGKLQARLRAEHLNTHLAQAALLSAAQVSRYNAERGYAPGGLAAPPDHAGHAGHGSVRP